MVFDDFLIAEKTFWNTFLHWFVKVCIFCQRFCCFILFWQADVSSMWCFHHILWSKCCKLKDSKRSVPPIAITFLNQFTISYKWHTHKIINNACHWQKAKEKTILLHMLTNYDLIGKIIQPRNNWQCLEWW